MKNTEPNITLTVIKDKLSWKKTLFDTSNYDFYHTYDYHELSKSKNERAVLLKYNEGHSIICLPLIIRSIDGTPYFDATSVYGYAGPLKKNIDSDFDNTHFKKTLNEYLVKENIVSLFSRLNPFIENQEVILKNIGKIEELGNVVYLDLKETTEFQVSTFSKTTKRYLNKGQRHLEIKKSSSLKNLESFIDLYYENMNRVNANKAYYFNKEYFLNFINSNDFETDIVYAVDKETNNTISAALIIKTNNIIQYHLSGTHSDFLHLSPLRSLLNKVRIDYTGGDFNYLNLGGGLDNKEDSLYKFKSSFSNHYKPFKIWTYIINENIYNELVLSKNFSANSNSKYFPKYRWEEKS